MTNSEMTQSQNIDSKLVYVYAFSIFARIEHNVYESSQNVLHFACVDFLAKKIDDVTILNFIRISCLYCISRILLGFSIVLLRCQLHDIRITDGPKILEKFLNGNSSSSKLIVSTCKFFQPLARGDPSY